MIAAIITGITSIFSGIFSMKGKQGTIIEQAIKTAGDVNASEAQREMAQMQILQAELSSESWLARSWRPIFMLVCMVIVISFWFGYVPPHLFDDMPPIVSELFDLIKIGLGGYIGARTVDKIFNTLKIGKVLKTYVEKKLL